MAPVNYCQLYHPRAASVRLIEYKADNGQATAVGLKYPALLLQAKRCESEWA